VIVKTMTAGKFKAQCHKVIDRVNATRGPVFITRNGRPIAKLVPVGMRKKDFLGCLVGIIEIVGAIESPVQPAEDWNALR
jgi:prevent-host-death family protein